MIRAAMVALAVVLSSGFATADEKKKNEVPPPRPAEPKVDPKTAPLPPPTSPNPPPPAAMGWPAVPARPAVVVYPGYGYGWAQGALPPRICYGPSVSPLEYPYTHFVPGYPYPGYTA